MMSRVTAVAQVKYAGIVISSVNDRIRERPGWRQIRCYPSNGFFVLVYSPPANTPGLKCMRVYFNQDGKEVFCEIQESGPLLLKWRQFTEWLKAKTGEKHGTNSVLQA